MGEENAALFSMLLLVLLLVFTCAYFFPPFFCFFYRWFGLFVHSFDSADIVSISKHLFIHRNRNENDEKFTRLGFVGLLCFS